MAGRVVSSAVRVTSRKGSILRSKKQPDGLAEVRAGGDYRQAWVRDFGEGRSSRASYAVITPSGSSNARTLELRHGEGTVKFHHARWEDMPTQYMIVNAFADLEVIEFRGATLSKRVGGKDLSDQRIIR